ncbi:MAG: histidine--tRNA ligase [Solirubrobacterales bacterium]
MAKRFKAPRGTSDVLPEQAEARDWVQSRAARVLTRAGYQPISTPILEETDLFIRGVGRSTDIVTKEMFTFEDKGQRSLTLRPEGTAPICRAYVEHGMHKWAQPVKLSYSGPFFRHERPQAGRYRQFHQIGIEAIGTASPLADAEAIIVLSELLNEIGVPDLRLRLGSLGSFGLRVTYLDELTDYLRENEHDLSEAVRERFRLNPLRAFDAKDPETREVMRGAPTLVGKLAGEDAQHFEEVRDLLDSAGVEYTIDPTLVRGLDYYTRTIFSFDCAKLGSQSEIGGGGRYDGLVEQLGGPATPAVGWAVGLERILLALGEELGRPDEERRVFIAHEEEFSPRLNRQVIELLRVLRNADVHAEVDLIGRSIKTQMKQADRLGATHVLLLALHGWILRDMKTGHQTPVELADLVERVVDAPGE